MIDSGDKCLAAIYHAAQKPLHGHAIGCLILVGGPQYRVGAHRQYVALARGLARRGIGVLRFDYQGMGDSEGTLDAIENRGDDIAAAASALCERLGPGAKIFPWGLCEGASAIFMHHQRINNMAGAIIANPWVGDARVEAQVRWRHYYLGRLNYRYMMRRLKSGSLVGSNFFENAKGLLRGVEYFDDDSYSPGLADLPHDMVNMLGRNKPVLYLASTDDRERETFDYALKTDARWKPAQNAKLFIRRDIVGADHTFSDYAAKQSVEALTFEFIDQQTRPIGSLAPAA
ncbi:MAG: hydrolase 1, exosortase A system-associated [Pseudomonadota bacterium]